MSDALKFKVEDMTCGHCAAAISRAIRKTSPAATVVADHTSKLVTVTGATDPAAVMAQVSKAGFTPTKV